MKAFYPFLLLLLATSAYGGMSCTYSVIVDLTSEADAKTKVSWTTESTQKVTVTKQGLGFDAPSGNAFIDFTLMTEPIALGLAWRPLTGISPSVHVFPGFKSITIAKGQKSTPWRGEVFARYSPDKVHWSTWQALAVTEEPKPGAESVAFEGLLAIPKSESKGYDKLLRDYARLDVPWVSDEEAAVRWIVKNQPDYFAKNLPFIGYIQFQLETSLPANQRLTKLQFHLGWALSGVHSTPKDPSAYEKSNGPWRYDASRSEEPKMPK